MGPSLAQETGEGKGLNRWGSHLTTSAPRRRPVRPTFRYPRSRSDAAAGGNHCAMTMRVVPEAVEPRARAQIYVQHDLVWHRGDNLRGGNSR